MLFYKNNTPWTKTINGISFEPGEVKETDRYINVYGFIRVSEPKKPTDVEISTKKTESEVKEPDKSTGTIAKKKRYKKPTNTINENIEIKEEMSNG